MHCMGCNDSVINLHDMRKNMTETKKTRLAKLLEKKGWSATELARRAKVAPSTVTRVAAGAMPLGGTAKKLAEALGVTVDRVVG